MSTSKGTEQWIERTDNSGFGHGKDAYTERHPSYGLIGISRVSGQASLFDSDTIHQHYIEIRISEARRIVDGTHEFTMADKRLTSLYMSEAQFAQFITSPNVGDGVPCTLNFSAGDRGEPWLGKFGNRPEAPRPEPFDLKFKREAADRAQIISDNLSELTATVNALLDGTEKTNKGTITALKKKLEEAQRQINANIPYVLEVAAEQLEKKVSSAVTDFEAYVSNSLQARGLAAVQEGAPKLSVPLTQNLLSEYAARIEDAQYEDPESGGNDFVDGNGTPRR